MQFSIPVALSYKNRDHIVSMGPFERSLERDFALAANKKAIAECSDIEKLREVAGNLMEGWSNMQDATASLIKENLELRQAMQMQQADLEAADALLGEASDAIKTLASQKQSSPSRKFPWPFG